MMATGLRFGIPDIDCVSSAGVKVNPSALAGHALVVLFLPTNQAAASAEVAAYLDHRNELVAHDAWIVAFADPGLGERCRIITLTDAQLRAWRAFTGLVDSPARLDRNQGATFFFTRGGKLHRYWSGPGHLSDVLQELEVVCE
jgi:hypothetical protein